jgi:hypothetical protein
MKNTICFFILSISLTGCMTLSGNYVLTAHAPNGEDLIKNSRWAAEGGGIYSVRNALCANYPGAIVVIKNITTGEELKSESPHQCRGNFVPKNTGNHNEVVEMWDFSFDDRTWILGNSSAVKEQSIREYILEGEVIDNWSELVSSHYVAVSSSSPAFQEIVSQGGSIKYFYNRYANYITEHCESPHINVVEEQENGIIFEWRHQGCSGYPPQHEIRRMQEAEGGVLSLNFVKKTERLENVQRQQWIELLRNAKRRV